MSKMSGQEAALKKKLQVFLVDLVKVGTTNGFKYFNCYVRGKEEVVISIKNNLPSTSSTSYVSSLSQPPSRKQSLRPTDSFNSSCLPYEKTSLTLSHSTQVGLSGMREADVGLPPASPSELEPSEDEEFTNFLIAGYSRYSCPYVWIRSNHERLMKAVTNADIDKDSPLRLKSTAKWHEADVYMYQVIAELVKLCMFPAPRNPFEVDFAYLRSLSQPSQILATAAMVTFLDKIITHTPDSCPYSRQVFQEHQLLSKLHFSSLHDLTDTMDVPILKQLRQQPTGKNQHQLSSYPSSPSSSSSSSSYSRQRQQHQDHRGAPSRYPQSQSQQAYAGHAPGHHPSAVRSTTPVNNARSVPFGQGPAGAFPGGFDRMPAPSMF